MSPIASLNPTPAAFPPINSRAHGHKHGMQPESADASTGAVENLFGSLLQSVEKVIGLHVGPASAVLGAAAAAGSAAASSLSHKQQPNGSQTPMPSGNIIDTVA